MKQIERRVLNLEQTNDPNRLTGINIVIVSCKDHVENPDNYNKVLQSDKTSETGFKRHIYHLEPKQL